MPRHTGATEKCRKAKKKWCVVPWNREEIEHKIRHGFGPVGFYGLDLDFRITSAERELAQEGCNP